MKGGMTTLVRFLARPALSAIFISGGLRDVRKPHVVAPAAEAVTSKVSPLLQKALPPQVARLVPTDTLGLVRLNGAVHLVGGLLVATGKAPRLGATALAVSLIPTTIAGHAFWRESEEQARSGQKIHLFKNVAIMGGLLLAAVDTAGRPGLPWRARRAARDLKRGSRTARREARLSIKAARAEGHSLGSQGRRRLESAGHSAGSAARDAARKLPG